MSFLWHGLTEQGAQVPVQVDAQGRVIAVDGTSAASNWEKTGSTLSPADPDDSVLVGGVLPSAPNISLNADGALMVGRIAQGVSTNCIANKDGSSYPLELRSSLSSSFLTFKNSDISNPYQNSIGFAGGSFRLTVDNIRRALFSPGGDIYFGDLNTLSNYTLHLKDDKSATFAGKVYCSAETVSTDSTGTLTTKGYVDALVSGGVDTVGSMGFFKLLNIQNIDYGDTTDGVNLQPASGSGLTNSSRTVTGTWRCLGYADTATPTGNATLYQKISD